MSIISTVSLPVKSLAFSSVVLMGASAKPLTMGTLLGLPFIILGGMLYKFTPAYKVADTEPEKKND